MMVEPNETLWLTYIWIFIAAPLIVRYLDPSVDSYPKRVIIGSILSGCMIAVVFILALVVSVIGLVA